MLARNGLYGKRAARAVVITMAASAIVSALSACGGSDGGATADVASVAKSESAPSGASASFFDGIFNTTSGSGYYIFGWNSILDPETGGAHGDTGITRTRFGVIDGSDTTLRESYVPTTGTDALQYSKMVYITAEGAFPADSLPYDDLGPHTKIFQRLPDGFDFGVQGMSAPLYRVTLDVRDVAGQSVKSVVKLFQGGDPVTYTPPPSVLLPLITVDSVRPTVDYIANPLTVNMPRLVFPSSDTTLMPAGSQVFVPTYTAQTTFLRIDLSKLWFDGSIQDPILKRSGIPLAGEIMTLGGYQYSALVGTGWGSGFFDTMDGHYVAEYQGKVYRAEVISAGDRLSSPVTTEGRKHLTAPRPAFNKIAAAFLTRQLGSTPAQTHNVVYRPTDCYQNVQAGAFVNSCPY